LDTVRTAVNVEGDMVGSLIVQRLTKDRSSVADDGQERSQSPAAALSNSSSETNRVGAQ